MAGGSLSLKSVAGASAYAMIAGGADNDGQARGGDETGTIAPSYGSAGYHNGDVNFDQQVRGNDVTGTLAPNFGKGIPFDTVLNLDSRLTRSQHRRQIQKLSAGCLHSSCEILIVLF